MKKKRKEERKGGKKVKDGFWVWVGVRVKGWSGTVRRSLVVIRGHVTKLTLDNLVGFIQTSKFRPRNFKPRNFGSKFLEIYILIQLFESIFEDHSRIFLGS